ncbi:ribonuclease HIII [bacterium]|nr:ribonuclease HIII [candidate division CSSED10-310 bacterium]
MTGMGQERQDNPPRDESVQKMAEAGIYSEVSQINALLASKLEAARAAGFVFEDARPIQYGSRLTFRLGDAVVCACAYYSARKGFSFVVDRSVPEKTARKLKTVFLGDPGSSAASGVGEEREFAWWIGSDEAGKGDYFGPLVTAAFLASHPIIPQLRSLGVRDSKLIGNAECRSIARQLFRNYKDRISVIEIVPATYNRLYEQFRAEGKKLNELLAWSHARAIQSLLTLPGRHPEAVVIDQFAGKSSVTRYLDVTFQLIVRPRAEDNIAVAAASILARARYLYRLNKLSELYRIKLVPGAGDAADDAARKLVEASGSSVLTNTVKLHFRNTGKIRSVF